MYRDPELDKLDTQLIAANPTLAAALANYDAYKDRALELNAYLFPFVTATGLTTPSATTMGPAIVTPYQMTYFGNSAAFAEVHYEVDLWDQIHNSIAVGVFTAQAARLNFICSAPGITSNRWSIKQRRCRRRNKR